jgi:hypothetical protein
MVTRCVVVLPVGDERLPVAPIDRETTYEKSYKAASRRVGR